MNVISLINNIGIMIETAFFTGTWPCLNSHHGSVSIEIHAPEMQTYMGAIDYSIQI